MFSPDSVALVGASNTPGSWGFGIMRHLLVTKKRKVYPVNPAASEVFGIPAYASVLDIPAPVDLAVIAVAAPLVAGIMGQCLQKGVGAVVVVSGGFAEAGEAGRQLEAELVRVARDGGISFIGPNSMGHLNNHARLSTLAWTGEVPAGPVALVAQSGNVSHRIMYSGLRSGFGFSKAVSTGNEALLCLEDYLEYLGQDEESGIITAYIEGLREGRRFFQLAKEITRRKPIVAIKSGGTSGSAQAARSHTRALAGSDAVYAAAFRQAGVIRVDDDDELSDVVAALLHQPLPRGRRVGILTVGGGLGVMAAEATEKEGLEVAWLSESTMERLNRCLPPRWSHGNPVDTAGIHLTQSPVIFPALWALMEDENIDAILFQATVGLSARRLARTFASEEIKAFRASEEENMRQLGRRVQEHGKPVLMVAPSVEFTADPEVSAIFHREGIPIYHNPRRAARVVRHLAWYRHYLDGQAEQ